MLSAGTNVDWLRDDLGIIASAAESHEVAAQCEHTDGVVYVPALMGLGTPHWDYGARGTLLGLTRGSGRPQLVRAVLEGIAHRGADLLEAAEADYGDQIGAIRVDGGMSQNPTFVQALANATGRSDRGVTAHRSDDRGRRLPCRSCHRGVGIVRRHRRGMEAERCRRADRATRSQAVGQRDRAGPRMDTRPVRARLLELLRSPRQGRLVGEHLERISAWTSM
jgi:hypothetical protein